MTTNWFFWLSTIICMSANWLFWLSAIISMSTNLFFWLSTNVYKTGRIFISSESLQNDILSQISDFTGLVSSCHFSEIFSQLSPSSISSTSWLNYISLQIILKISDSICKTAVGIFSSLNNHMFQDPSMCHDTIFLNLLNVLISSKNR